MLLSGNFDLNVDLSLRISCLAYALLTDVRIEWNRSRLERLHRAVDADVITVSPCIYSRRTRFEMIIVSILKRISDGTHENCIQWLTHDVVESRVIADGKIQKHHKQVIHESVVMCRRVHEGCA